MLKCAKTEDNVAKDLPGNFKRIRLELAREPGRPDGDAGIGYSVLAPLKADGLLDVETAKQYRDKCTVIRFHEGEDSVEGYLRRRPGGSWAFHYDLADGPDDDPAFKVETHRFRSGEYITVIEDAGTHTYRVASVESA